MTRTGLALLGVLLLPAHAGAHAFDPALLLLTEHDGGRFELVWKPPRGAVETVAPPVPVLPDHCALQTEPAGDEPEEQAPRLMHVDCGRRGLHGARLAVQGLAGTPVDVIVRVDWRDGHTTSGVLQSGADTLDLPGIGGGVPPAMILWRYGRLGVEHILLGVDHLLFVLGLLLLVEGWRRLALTISAFTLAHTLTLALAVLGVVHVPTPPVEAAIALSIVLVAAEAVRPPGHDPSLARRAPWLVAFAFGLLHGLGFAGALADIGLPADHLPLALLAFNAGVEVGQLAFVAVMLVPVRLLARAPTWLRLVPPYAIGTLAVTWTIERITRI